MSESNAVLERALESRRLVDARGEAVADRSGISADFVRALHRTVLREKPTTVLEVGMANGYSSLAILTALRALGGERRLVSIDPYQLTEWRGVGVEQVKRAGLDGMHELIAEPDYTALPDLVRQGRTIEFAYIDGWHTFDYTLLDFWYVDRILAARGVVAFNDCGLRAVHKVINFVLSHRRYVEIDVGLAPDYRSTNPLGSLRRRLTGRNGADRYLRKLEHWEPDWHFYADF